MTSIFFIPEFKEITNKVSLLADRNISLKTELESLQSKLDKVLSDANQTISNLQHQADQKISELEWLSNEKIAVLEAEKMRLETENAALDHRLSLVLKRLESLC